MCSAQCRIDTRCKELIEKNSTEKKICKHSSCGGCSPSPAVGLSVAQHCNIAVVATALQYSGIKHATGSQEPSHGPPLLSVLADVASAVDRAKAFLAMLSLSHIWCGSWEEPRPSPSPLQQERLSCMHRLSHRPTFLNCVTDNAQWGIYFHFYDLLK